MKYYSSYLTTAVCISIQLNQIESFITSAKKNRFQPKISSNNHKPSFVYPTLQRRVESSTTMADTMSHVEFDKLSESKESIAIQRTLHRLTEVSSSMGSRLEDSDFQMEEHVYFKTSDDEDDFSLTGLKRYILRGPPSNVPFDPDALSSLKDGPRRRMARVGAPLCTIDIQEIISDDQSAPGTGSSAWDASIAMSLFFACHPDLFEGKILELGCGVGVAGILSSVCAGATSNGIPSPPDAVESITLTDHSPEVLDFCISNARRYIPDKKFIVKKLDWYETDFHDIEVEKNEYNTVIGTECAYLFPDIKPLAKTIVSNLAPTKKLGRSFMLGPYNRDALHYLESELEETYQMSVDTGVISMESLQLKTIWLQDEEEKGKDLMINGKDGSKIRMCEYAAKGHTEFLMLESMHHKDFLGGKDFAIFFKKDDDDKHVLRDMELELSPE